MQREEAEKARIRNRAEYFDRLISDPGWSEVLLFMAQRVNDTVAEAAGLEPFEVEKKTTLVTQWDAQRRMLDAVQAFIADTRKARDEMNALEKQEEEVV